MVPPRKYSDPARYKYLRTLYPGKKLASSPRLRWGLLALALGVYIANFVGGDRGVLRRLELQRELKSTETANARFRLQKERLIQEVNLKENDLFSLEKLAREKYWMVGPGERVYRFEDDEVVPPLSFEQGGDADGAAGPGEDSP